MKADWLSNCDITIENEFGKVIASADHDFECCGSLVGEPCCENARTMELLAKAEQMKLALERLALNGIHCDTNPTMTNVKEGWPVVRWYEYLRHADSVVREIAKEGLK